MRKISVKVVHDGAPVEVAALAAHITQHGHDPEYSTIKHGVSKVSDKFKGTLAESPHNTLRQFGMVTLQITGASRRFLAQITRRRVGVTFMSGSLQYSNFSNADYVVPLQVIKLGPEAEEKYLNACITASDAYKDLLTLTEDTDTAGYVQNQALRNVLLISATPQAWIEMINQRICCRNTDETRYVMLLCWKALVDLNDWWYHMRIGAPCTLTGMCPEGSMSCGEFSLVGMYRNLNEFWSYFTPIDVEQEEGL